MKGYLLQQYIKLQLFMKKEDGASAIEYAIIAGLIGVAMIAAAETLGTDVTEVFTAISKKLPDGVAEAGGNGGGD